MQISRRGALAAFGAVFLAAAAGSALSAFALGWFASPVYGAIPGSCNVLGIRVHGTVVGTRSDVPIADTVQVPDQYGATVISYPNYAVAEDIEERVRAYKGDPSIKAVLVDVNSGGGAEVGGDDIARAIREMGVPSVSVIRDVGASSGYLAASAADVVFASQDSAVGSIGATYSYVSNVEKNKKEGLQFESLASGPYKDMFNPDKPLTDAERALIMRDIKLSRDSFVKLVAGYRNRPVEEIDVLADGSAMRGTQALEKGLIDRIGSSWDAIEYLEELLAEPVTVCW